MLEDRIRTGAAALGIPVAEDHLPQVRRYYDLLVEWNEKFNLTRITDEDEAADKHLLDSLAVLRLPSASGWHRLVDVGSGAGFPGIAIKIVRPDLEVTLIEATAKKVSFLEAAVKELGLTGVRAYHGRGEEYGCKPGFRERFDIVTARAVARLGSLLEYCLPLAAVGGQFVAYKGPEGEDELREASKAVGLLGGRPSAMDKFALPDGSGDRCLIVVDKVRATPAEYPRPTAKIAKHPL